MGGGDILAMSKLDTYKGLNEESKLTTSFSMPEVAKECCQLNYGAHRLLSAMVHQLRANRKKYVEDTWARDAALPENRRLNLHRAQMASPLADAIEAALNQDHYY